jgi:hypothetical protein
MLRRRLLIATVLSMACLMLVPRTPAQAQTQSQSQSPTQAQAQAQGIAGDWCGMLEAGLPLAFGRGTEEAFLARTARPAKPQEPKSPYPYAAIEVEYDSAGRGTGAYPQDSGGGVRRAQSAERSIPSGGRAARCAVESRAARGRGPYDGRPMELEGLNHMFQTCRKCTVAEYGQFDETFSPMALEVLGERIARHSEVAATATSTRVNR